MIVVAVSGESKSGKTTLIEELIRELSSRGLKVLAVKHGRDFEFDKKGKDSWRMWNAGADTAMLSDGFTTIMLREELSLEELGRISKADVVIAEGFKRANIRKIVVKGKENLKVSGEVIAVLKSEDVLSGNFDVRLLADLIVERKE